jgi:hypothetical protein
MFGHRSQGQNTLWTSAQLSRSSPAHLLLLRFGFLQRSCGWFGFGASTEALIWMAFPDGPRAGLEPPFPFGRSGWIAKHWPRSR